MDKVKNNLSTNPQRRLTGSKKYNSSAQRLAEEAIRGVGDAQKENF